MKRYLCLSLAAACLLVPGGCASANAAGREPEDTVLVQVIGVDVDGQGVCITAAGEDGKETVLATAWGGTLAEAFAALHTAGDKYLSLTSVTHVLVGDGVDLALVLNYVMDDPDMSYMARVWAAGFAGGLMEALREDGLGRFQLLEKGSGTATVKTALAELTERGATALPALALRENGLDAVGTLYFEVRG